MQQAKILLIEDDELASEMVYSYLQECGFEVTAVFTATESVSYVKNNSYDLLILDLNLPDFDGYEVLKSIRKFTSIPVIVSSGYEDTKSKLLAFKYGATDYMVKPFDLEELEARIWIQLGRYSEIELEEQKEQHTFEIVDGTVYFQGEPLTLTTIEYEILSLLIKNSNNVIQRETLLDSLSSLSSPRSLDNHIKNIRKKIGDNGNKAKYLKTEYGVGYILIN